MPAMFRKTKKALFSPLWSRGGSWMAALAAGMVTVVLAPPARAETYQVGPGKPYASLAEVAGLLGPGDLVEVDGDATYDGVQLTQSGTSAQKITIRGIRVNGKRPTFAGGTNT